MCGIVHLFRSPLFLIPHFLEMRPCVCNALRHVRLRLLVANARRTPLARLDCVSAGSKGSACGSSQGFGVSCRLGSLRLPSLQLTLVTSTLLHIWPGLRPSVSLVILDYLLRVGPYHASNP